LFKLFAILMFTLNGWKLVQNVSSETIKKSVVLGAPHTSNWDLIISMGGFHKMRFPLKFFIKKEWLKIFPLNKILLAAGAVSVDRDKKGTMVDKMAELIRNSEENIALMVTPEGTRKRNCNWKTGFYYTALKAQVPIVLTCLDYSKKLAVFGPAFMPSGDFKKDMEIVKDYYKDVVAKYPENFCLDIYREDETEAGGEEKVLEPEKAEKI